MESIVIHPENADQLKKIKEFLKGLKIPFEQQSIAVPSHVKKSIDRGLLQADAGQTISLEEFKEKHFTKK